MTQGSNKNVITFLPHFLFRMLKVGTVTQNSADDWYISFYGNMERRNPSPGETFIRPQKRSIFYRFCSWFQLTFQKAFKCFKR